MSEFDYLKKVNIAEADVYEASRRLNKTRDEFNKVVIEVKKRKQKLTKKIDDIKKEKDELIDKKQTYDKTHTLISKKSFITRAIITIGIIFVFQAILYAVTVLWYRSQTPSDAIVQFGFVIGIPILIVVVIGVLINICTGEDDFALILFVVGVIIIGVPVALSYIYYLLCFNIGISINTAIILFTFIASLISYLISYLRYKRSNKKTSEYLRKYMLKYNKELKEINEALSSAQSEANIEFKKMDSAVCKMRADVNFLETSLKNKKAYLKALYDEGVIHPDYKDWNSVCIFIKYFEMGICTSLKGPNGAYSIYRQEIIGSRTLNTVNNISSTLDTISQTQSYMQEQISAINGKINRLIVDRYGF